MVNTIKLIITLIYFFAYTFNAIAFSSNASHAILIDFTTGAILFDKNSNQPITPSSMTKLMTSYLVFEALKDGKIKLDDELTISEESHKTQGTKMFLETGSKVKVDDLIRGMIIQSGNDACVALAEGISGSEEAFVQKMNSKAFDLNLTNSKFANSNGLPNNNHYMSVYDLAILSRYLIKDFPQNYGYFSEKDFTFNNITQPNRNTALGENGIDGLKTGHTIAGGYGIVVSALQNNKRLIAVVNGLSNEDQRIEEAKKLLDHGFNDFHFKPIFKSNESIVKTNIWHGSLSQIDLVSTDNIELILPKSVDISKLRATVTYDSLVFAPIKKDQQLGTLTIEIPNQQPITARLVSAENVEEASFLGKMIQNMFARIATLKNL